VLAMWCVDVIRGAFERRKLSPAKLAQYGNEYGLQVYSNQ